MIRKRDFLLFVFAVLFLSGGIGTTLIVDNLSIDNQVAAAIEFTSFADPSGAESVLPEDNRGDNLTRLKKKLASGEGNIAGGPIFTSVDDISSSATAVTDQTEVMVTLMGHTLDGNPLRSSDLWRFVGFSADQQIAVALNEVPIFGVRTDKNGLDACGGTDEGLGYRFYILPGENIDPDCFSRPR